MICALSFVSDMWYLCLVCWDMFVLFLQTSTFRAAANISGRDDICMYMFLYRSVLISRDYIMISLGTLSRKDFRTRIVMYAILSTEVIDIHMYIFDMLCALFSVSPPKLSNYNFWMKIIII